MIHQIFVWQALYILFKFVKALIGYLCLAIGKVWCVWWFSWILCNDHGLVQSHTLGNWLERVWLERVNIKYIYYILCKLKILQFYLQTFHNTKLQDMPYYAHNLLHSAARCLTFILLGYITDTVANTCLAPVQVKQPRRTQINTFYKFAIIDDINIINKAKKNYS